MKNNSYKILKLSPEQAKPAGEIIARAFQDYPVSVYLLPDSSNRLKLQKTTFWFSVLYGIHYAEAYTTSPKLEGVAIWEPPRKKFEFPFRLIRGNLLIAGLRLLFDVKLTTINRSIPLVRCMQSAHKRNAPFPHWYLQLLGVDPKAQGKGYGNILMRTMIKRIDKQKLPIYLETNLKKNVGFYQNHGFKVVEKFNIPGSDVPSWCMLRESSI